MWMWTERQNSSYGEGTDASRAHVLLYAAWAWPPNDQVRTWLDEGWSKWEKEEPKWCCEHQAWPAPHTFSLLSPRRPLKSPHFILHPDVRHDSPRQVHGRVESEASPSRSAA